MSLVPVFSRCVLLDWTGQREKIQSNSKPNTRANWIYKLGSYLVSDSHWLICVAWLCGSWEDGETNCACEIGDLRSLPFPAEDNDGSLEGPAHEDSSQGLRELDQRHSLARSPRRHLHVNLSLSFSLCVRVSLLSHDYVLYVCPCEFNRVMMNA